MIFRDDDISYLTDLNKFSKVHDLFIKYGVKHTIALICRDIEKNIDLVDYIKANKIDVQIHCLDHSPFTENENLESELYDCAQIINQIFGTPPSTVYPPWNKADENVESICNKLGLVCSTNKISLSAYVRTMGNVKEDTINFHYWADQEIILLEPALKIFTSMRSKNICDESN